VLQRKAVYGGVNHPRIDGKDGVRVPIPDCRAALLSP
jgi:hypothetical protein